ncbi:MAG TPA: heme-binding protein [bacterium]|nr:heme-binding protein [bacterium]
MRKIFTVLLAAIVSVCLWGKPAMAAEEARYEVVKKYGDFELRRYAPHLVAEVEVKGTFGSAAYQAFQTLFKYIDGNNVKQEKIAMTAPVEQQTGEKIPMTAPVTQRPAESEKIPMTAPVTQSKGGGSYFIGFVMPADYTMENIPEPLDPKVKIREVPARMVAARQYSGSWGKRNYEKNLRILRDAISQAGLKPIAEPVFARYNHPGVASSKRRNEVLIEVAP